MLKLQELKKKQQQAKQAESASSNASASATPSSEGTGSSSSTDPQSTSNTYILKRQNSKELAEKRKQKSKENVFSLRRSGGAKKGKKKAERC